jgi:hypothetical protein
MVTNASIEQLQLVTITVKIEDGNPGFFGLVSTILDPGDQVVTITIWVSRSAGFFAVLVPVSAPGPDPFDTKCEAL